MSKITAHVNQKTSFDWEVSEVMMCKPGDLARVRDNLILRSGEEGVIVAVFDDVGSVAIDFFCDVFGSKKGLPTVEMWLLEEIDILPVGGMN